MIIEGHTTRAFDGALSSLHMRVVEMGGLVLSQVQLAITAYADWREDAARTVVAREPTVNGYDLAVDEEALRVIALRQPVASDLRTVMAVEKAVSELERIGDECKKIARLVLSESERHGFRPGQATSHEVRQLGRLAQNLLRAALDAFDHLDTAAAQIVIVQDKELDAEYAVGLRRLLSRAMEDPRTLHATVESAFVLKSIERIGDHSRNLARHVLFLSHGATAPARDATALAQAGPGSG